MYVVKCDTCHHEWIEVLSSEECGLAEKQGIKINEPKDGINVF
jgi:hypothetical protein